MKNIFKRSLCPVSYTHLDVYKRQLIFLGHGPQRRLGHVDDGGQDHDGQHDDGREQARAGAEAEGILHGGHQHDHTHQAVDHGGDTRRCV